MKEQKDFLTDSYRALDALGGEALSDSGFESEIPDPDFARDDPELEGTER
ncbi:MAG: hypothetical protein M3Y57_19650 [Acidobacteriota bacterium]|nr:hypothetical protein [Acidobacteriota bacterium]